MLLYEVARHRCAGQGGIRLQSIGTQSALSRAARYGDGFTVSDANRDVDDRYAAELKKHDQSDHFAPVRVNNTLTLDELASGTEAGAHLLIAAARYRQLIRQQ